MVMGGKVGGNTTKRHLQSGERPMCLRRPADNGKRSWEVELNQWETGYLGQPASVFPVTPSRLIVLP